MILPCSLAIVTIVLVLSSAVRVDAFAAGGFGGGSASSNKKSPKKKTSQATKATQKTKNLLTPEGRLEHIRDRIEAADFSPLTKLIPKKHADGQIEMDIDPNAICVIDNFLGESLLNSIRSEAISLLPKMVPSQSTRWDEDTQTVVAYEKKGVLSMQIEGGSIGYAASPRLVEYIVALTSNLSTKLNRMLPDAYKLSGQEQTNKLAVCLGDGSYYDKHIDNLGGTSDAGDRRKLTALIYLQPPNSHDGQSTFPNEKVEEDPRGGYFRAFDVPEVGDVTCIAPRGDRLVVFWSDSLVHDVSPSYAPNGDADRRFALTTWLIADKDTGEIKETDADVTARHFNFGTSSIGKG